MYFVRRSITISPVSCVKRKARQQIIRQNNSEKQTITYADDVETEEEGHEGPLVVFGAVHEGGNGHHYDHNGDLAHDEDDPTHKATNRYCQLIRHEVALL